MVQNPLHGVESLRILASLNLNSFIPLRIHYMELKVDTTASTHLTTMGANPLHGVESMTYVKPKLAQALRIHYMELKGRTGIIATVVMVYSESITWS